MSYPPPPGLNSNRSLHPSLPARPTSSLPPRQAFNVSTSRPGGSAPPGYPIAGAGYGGFAPRSVAAQPSYNSYQVHQAPQPYSQSQQQYEGYNAPPLPQDAYGAAPQIRNPFAPPSATAGPRDYEEDPDMAAQIAQWQSAYASKDTYASSSTSGYTGPNPATKRFHSSSEASGAATSANAAPLGRPEASGPSMSSAAINSAAHTDSGVANIVTDSKDPSSKTVVRSGGGSTWTDTSLLEWDPAHFRIFVGNLAGEVTDESLYKAFSRWPSIQKARVIREKRTTKSKGYGFVSFSDGEEFFAAAREMQGKYIGSHPILIKKSTTEIKAVTPRDKRGGKNGKGNKGKGGNRDKDRTGAGVQKAGSKTKGGLKVLG